MARAALLDVAGAAERLGTAERHVRRLVSERRIPFVKVDGKVRFRPEDLERWIDANTTPAAS